MVVQNLTEDQRIAVRSVKEIAEGNFRSSAFDWNSDVPWENLQVLADHGFMGANFDAEYGGGGLTEYEVILMAEEIGRICPDTAYVFAEQCFMAPRALHEFGRHVAKERFLPRVTGGDDGIAIAISEPDAGSDVKAMQTTIEEDGDGFVLNGEKTWVSNARSYGNVVIWAKFPDDTFGTVITEFDVDGLELGSEFTNMAGHEQSHFYLNDVYVPEGHLLTRGRDGFKKNLQALNWERIGEATISNAIGLCGIDRALEYSREREQFGEVLFDFQGIKWKIADAVKDLQASRALTHQSAKAAIEDGSSPDPTLASIAKLYSNEMVERVVSEALQIHGAVGYQQGHALEYLYRLARGQRFAAGTDEILKNTIARLLKRDGIQ